MKQESCPVTGVEEVGRNIYLLTFVAREISSSVRPGQFVNIRVGEGFEPLLRRPFSVYRSSGDLVEVVFNVVGKGTLALKKKRQGDTIDVIGPLGVPYSLSGGDFETALLLGGGLGVAPLPLATAVLKSARRPFATFLGARSADQLVEFHLENLLCATDDGTKGYHGTVLDLLKDSLKHKPLPRPKIFACGPTPMLRAVATFALENTIPCEVSLEGSMACGIGICQGCPVELTGAEKKYALMCKDGPVFDVTRIVL